MTATRDPASADHRAFLYDDASTFVAGVGAFVREGLNRGDRVLAAIEPEKLAWLREHLGSGADAVDVADPTGLYARHGPMLTTVLAYLAWHGGPGRVRIVAEQALARRAPADVRAYMRYEAASNVAYTRYDASVLCPYDAGRLPSEILDDALRTHPEVLDRGRPKHSPRFTDPRAFVRAQACVEPVPPGAQTCPLERLEDVAAARALVRAQAETAGLAQRDVEDLAVAVSEVAANALVHGGAPRRVWSYVDDGMLVCHVRDAGSGLADPLAGYLPPDPAGLGGRGLWLAHQCCDIVEVAGDATGTAVSLRIRVPAATA